MVLTKKYTIENYKTGYIELVDIPDKVYSMTLENVFRNIVDWSVGIGINFIELLFFIIFNNQGWMVIRLPLNRQDPASFYRMLAIKRNTGINGEAFYGRGTPDFFLWKPNENKYKFVEIKCTENCLNKYQEQWFEKFGYELFIVKLAKIAKNDKLLTEKEMIEQNRFVR